MRYTAEKQLFIGIIPRLELLLALIEPVHMVLLYRIRRQRLVVHLDSIDVNVRALTANDQVTPVRKVVIARISKLTVLAAVHIKYHQVEVLVAEDKWYGMTYKEDKEIVATSIRKLVDAGLYPENIMEALKK